jgi:hypothetical protein
MVWFRSADVRSRLDGALVSYLGRGIKVPIVKTIMTIAITVRWIGVMIPFSMVVALNVLKLPGAKVPFRLMLIQWANPTA